MTRTPPSTSKRVASVAEEGETDAQALARLRAEMAQRDDILAIVAHELRNPLHALSLHLTLARTVVQAGAHVDGAERLRRAELTLRRYAERVTVLMELLASPGAVYPLTRRDVDIASLLRGMVESLEEEARSRGIDVVVEVAPAPDARGWTRTIDPIAMEQLVDNLLLNAFKHSRATRITVRLRAGSNGNADADQDRWVIEVGDNGTGIALEDQASIFGKFAVASHSPRGTGTGLGLWIVARLVQAMRGEMALRSAPGDGCTFTIRIPDGPQAGDESKIR